MLRKMLNKNSNFSPPILGSTAESSHIYQRRKTDFFIFTLIMFLITSCSFPKITVWEDPLSAREHLQLGTAYEQQGDMELALHEYEQAVSELPEAHLMLGNVHFRRNNLQQSEKHYRLAIKKLPDHPAAYNNLAWQFYVQKQNLEEAERLARKAVNLSRPIKFSPCEDTLEKIRSLRKDHGKK